ncbi:hypothetical protein [EBPR siphovirus 6]|nr:hypothetical protein [EBPR siphovirus 6]
MYDLHMQGAGPLVNRLARFDRDVYLILRREVKAATEDVKTEAAKLLPTGNPLANWGQWNIETGRSGRRGVVTLVTSSRDLSFDDSRVRGSLAVQVRKTKTGIFGRVLLKDAAGAIFTTAGGRTPGSVFNRNLIDRHGSTFPRALGPAWTAKAPEAGDRIDRALERAQEAVA